MEHKYPSWFKDPIKVEQFLETRFPLTRDICPKRVRGIACNCKSCQQHDRAYKWKLIIKLWFIGKQSDRKIEIAQRWRSGAVGSMVQKIRRALDKKRSDGKTWSLRKRGRPEIEKLLITFSPQNLIDFRHQARS